MSISIRLWSIQTIDIGYFLLRVSAQTDTKHPFSDLILIHSTLHTMVQNLDFIATCSVLEGSIYSIQFLRVFCSGKF